MMLRAARIAAEWTHDIVLEQANTILDLNGFRISIRSNSQELLARMRQYFANVLSAGTAVNVDVLAVESPIMPPTSILTDVPLKYWNREPGKVAFKDAYCDLTDGRVVQKIRTGMRFLQSREHRIARGPCLANDNQVINFIISQYMNWLQQNGALIGHASGIAFAGRCLGIAGLSGGGKSTLMLHALHQSEAQFLTNDRLFLRVTEQGTIEALGVPKMPRVNPGTIVTNPALRSLLSESRYQSLRALPEQELWTLEEKHNVDIEDVFGTGRICHQAELAALVVLNWKRNDGKPLKINRVDFRQRPNLLDAVMKSPGPFYQTSNGTMCDNGVISNRSMFSDRSKYQAMLAGIEIWEASGRIDFRELVRHCGSVLGC